MSKRGRAADKKHPAVEAIGWIGMGAVILAYVLVTFNVISGNGFWYPLLNLIGAIGIIVIAEAKQLVQSVVLNVIWVAVAIVALAKFLL